MRQFLVTKLICSECGKPLEMQYSKLLSAIHADGEPTGADMVELSVLVKPCECVKHKLREVANAAKIISDMAGWLK